MEDSGLYIGKRHGECDDDGCGIPVVVDQVTEVEVEGGEYKICRDAIDSKEVLDFKQKSNFEVLEAIHKKFGCNFDQNEADSGDFILCRLVVNDTKKKDRSGTVQQILDQMQNEKSCRVSTAPKKMSAGGFVAPDKIKCTNCGWSWASKDSTPEEVFKCHKCGFDNTEFYVPRNVSHGTSGNNFKNGGNIRPEPTEEELRNRWHKKKQHVQQLANSIRKLRYNLTLDLASKDEKKFLTALVISIMDKTAERPGNEESEANGRFGVTGFRKKHVTIEGNKILFKYVGKSKVKHEKELTDPILAKALKRAIKNSPSNYVFTTSEGFRVKVDRINRYLEDYNVTAKDIRGYSANKWIIQKLEALASIEKDEKKRQRQFNQVAKQISKKVGHGAATLKKHYLIPELEERFVKAGKIIDLTKFYKKGGVVGPEQSDIEKKAITAHELKKLPENIMLTGKISGQEVWILIQNDSDLPSVQVGCQDYSAIGPFLKKHTQGRIDEYVEDPLIIINEAIGLGFKMTTGLGYVLMTIHPSEGELPILSPIYLFSGSDGSEKHGLERGIKLIQLASIRFGKPGKTTVREVINSSESSFSQVSNTTLIKLGLLLPGSENVSIDDNNFVTYVNCQYVYEDERGRKFKKGGQLKKQSSNSSNQNEGLTFEEFKQLPATVMLSGQIDGEDVWVLFGKQGYLVTIDIACQNYSKVWELLNSHPIGNWNASPERQWILLNTLIRYYKLSLGHGLAYSVYQEGASPLLYPVYFFSSEHPSKSYGLPEGVNYIELKTGDSENTSGASFVNLISSATVAIEKGVRTENRSETLRVSNKTLIELGILLPGAEMTKVGSDNLLQHLNFLYVYENADGIKYADGGEINPIKISDEKIKSLGTDFFLTGHVNGQEVWIRVVCDLLGSPGWQKMYLACEDYSQINMPDLPVAKMSYVLTYAKFRQRIKLIAEKYNLRPNYGLNYIAYGLNEPSNASRLLGVPVLLPVYRFKDNAEAERYGIQGALLIQHQNIEFYTLWDNRPGYTTMLFSTIGSFKREIPNKTLIELGLLLPGAEDVTINEQTFAKYVPFKYIYANEAGLKYADGGKINPNLLTQEELESLGSMFCLRAKKRDGYVWITVQRWTRLIRLFTAAQDFSGAREAWGLSNVNYITNIQGGIDQQLDILNSLIENGFEPHWGLNYYGAAFAIENSIVGAKVLMPIYALRVREREYKKYNGVPDYTSVIMHIEKTDRNVYGQCYMLCFVEDSAVQRVYIDNKTLIGMGLLLPGCEHLLIDKYNYLKYVPFEYLYTDLAGNKYEEGGEVSNEVTYEGLLDAGFLKGEYGGQEVWVKYNKSWHTKEVATQSFSSIEGLMVIGKLDFQYFIETLLRHKFKQHHGLNYVPVSTSNESLPALVLAPEVFIKSVDEELLSFMKKDGVPFIDALGENVFIFLDTSRVALNGNAPGFSNVMMKYAGKAGYYLSVSNSYLVALGILLPGCEDKAIVDKTLPVYWNFNYVYDDWNGRKYKDGGNIESDYWKEHLRLAPVFCIYKQDNGVDLYIQIYKERWAASSEDMTYAGYLQKEPAAETTAFIRNKLKNGFIIKDGLSYNLVEPNDIILTHNIPAPLLLPNYHTKPGSEEQLRLSELLSKKINDHAGIYLSLDLHEFNNQPGSTLCKVWYFDTYFKEQFERIIVPNMLLIKMEILLPGAEDKAVREKNFLTTVNFRYVYKGIDGQKYQDGGEVTAPETPATVEEAVNKLPPEFFLYGNYEGVEVWGLFEEERLSALASEDLKKAMPLYEPYVGYGIMVNLGFRVNWGLNYVKSKGLRTPILLPAYMANLNDEYFDVILKELNEADLDKSRGITIRILDSFLTIWPGVAKCSVSYWRKDGSKQVLPTDINKGLLIKLGILLPGAENVSITKDNLLSYMAFRFIYVGEQGEKYQDGGEVTAPETPATIEEAVNKLPPEFFLYGNYEGVEVWGLFEEERLSALASEDLKKAMPLYEPYVGYGIMVNLGFRVNWGLNYVKSKNLRTPILLPAYMAHLNDPYFGVIFKEVDEADLDKSRGITIRILDSSLTNRAGQTKCSVSYWRKDGSKPVLPININNALLIQLGILLPGSEDVLITKDNLLSYTAFRFIYVGEQGEKYEHGGEVTGPETPATIEEAIEKMPPLFFLFGNYDGVDTWGLIKDANTLNCASENLQKSKKLSLFNPASKRYKIMLELGFKINWGLNYMLFADTGVNLTQYSKPILLPVYTTAPGIEHFDYVLTAIHKGIDWDRERGAAIKIMGFKKTHNAQGETRCYILVWQNNRVLNFERVIKNELLVKMGILIPGSEDALITQDNFLSHVNFRFVYTSPHGEPYKDGGEIKSSDIDHMPPTFFMYGQYDGAEVWACIYRNSLLTIDCEDLTKSSSLVAKHDFKNWHEEFSALGFKINWGLNYKLVFPGSYWLIGNLGFSILLPAFSFSGQDAEAVLKFSKILPWEWDKSRGGTLFLYGLRSNKVGQTNCTFECYKKNGKKNSSEVVEILFDNAFLVELGMLLPGAETVEITPENFLLYVNFKYVNIGPNGERYRQGGQLFS